MATIETAEGETLVVKQNKSGSGLWIKARMGPEDGVTRNREIKIWRLYANTALADKPRSKSDLTAAKMREVADLLIGWEVAEGDADRRSQVEIDRIEIEEREPAKEMRPAIVPDWEDDWPGDGTASDKVRWFLENDPLRDDDEVAAAAGCSRSLVSDIKAGRD